MAETARGGVYLNPDGKTYHDAWGKEVKGDVVDEHNRIQQEQSDRNAVAYAPVIPQSTEALAAAVRSLVAPQQPEARRTSGSTSSSTSDIATSDDVRELTAETQRRGSRSER